MTTCDLVVVGAGPAGATAATVAARAGLSVCLLDRGLPRASHLPESWTGRTLPLLRGLGVEDVRDALESCAGVRFLSADGRFGMSVTIEREPGCDEPAVVRLNRSRFDDLLVANAIKHGAGFRPLHTVLDIALGEPGGPVTVTCATPQGGADVCGRYLVDASGKSALLAGRLGIREASGPLDPREAAFCHFAAVGDHRLAEEGSMSIVGIEHGYVFVIALGSRLVSIGVVVEAEHAGGYGNVTEMFWGELDEVACLQDLLAGADQLIPVIPALNAQFRATRFAGDRHAIAGDAAAFLDPFFSDGIDLAIELGVGAGQAATAALATTDPDERTALADAYDERARTIIDGAADGAAYAHLTSRHHGGLLAGLADPHLPTVLPLAALLQHAGDSPPDLSAARQLVRGARDAFASR
jgi:flavin-dependent dehydrogenase